MAYKNKEKQKEFQRNWLKNRRNRWILEFGGVCPCGSIDNLEFDHIDPSEKVSHRIWSWREDRIKEELSKCQLLCVECHKKKTAKQEREKIKHGTRSGYQVLMCKCVLCRGAQNEYMKKWRKLALSANS